MITWIIQVKSTWKNATVWINIFSVFHMLDYCRWMPCVEKVSGAIGDGLSMMWIVSFPIWGGMIFMGDIFSFMNNISYSLNKSSISFRLCPKSGFFSIIRMVPG